MSKVVKIHSSKRPVRRHFLGEWLETRGLKPMELVDLLNDPDRSSEFPEIDKTQVYRWLRGQLPQAQMQLRIAAALGFPEQPDKLMQDPTIDWLADFFRDKTEEQKEKAIQMLKLMFDATKTGTEG